MVVAVKFINYWKIYYFKTTFNLEVGKQYYIKNERGFTYESPVEVLQTNVSLIKDTAKLRMIVHAIKVRKEPCNTEVNNDLDFKRVEINSKKNATTVIWNDGTATVVKKAKQDCFDIEKAAIMCYLKKTMGDVEFKKFLKRIGKTEVVLQNLKPLGKF